MSSRPVGRHPAVLTVVLALAALAFSLSQTALLPTLGALAAELHTTTETVTWTLTGYLLSAAVLTPVLGRLGDQFGKRRLLIVSLVMFAAGGLIAGVSHRLGPIIAGRVLQGAGGGIFPLCFGLVRDQLPEHRRAATIGLLSALAGAGGGVGLLVGGLAADHHAIWWIFYLGAALAALVAVAVVLVVTETAHTGGGKVDLPGTALLAAGVTAPLLAISRGDRWGWNSAPTIGLIVLGILGLAAFWQVERHSPAPLIDPATFRRPRVLFANLATVLIGFVMFAAFLLIPRMVVAPATAGYGLAASSTAASLMLLPGCLLMLLAGPLSGRFRDPRYAMAAGAALAAAGITLLAAWHGSALAVTVSATVLLTGIGFTFAATPNVIIADVSVSQTGEATGVNVLMRSVGSSAGAQVIAVVIAAFGTEPGTGLPPEAAFLSSFAVAAVVSVAAVVLSLLIPSRHPSLRTLIKPG